MDPIADSRFSLRTVLKILKSRDDHLQLDYVFFIYLFIYYMTLNLNTGSPINISISIHHRYFFRSKPPKP